MLWKHHHLSEIESRNRCLHKHTHLRVWRCLRSPLASLFFTNPSDKNQTSTVQHQGEWSRSKHHCFCHRRFKEWMTVHVSGKEITNLKVKTCQKRRVGERQKLGSLPLEQSSSSSPEDQRSSWQRRTDLCEADDGEQLSFEGAIFTMAGPRECFDTEMLRCLRVCVLLSVVNVLWQIETCRFLLFSSIEYYFVLMAIHFHVLFTILVWICYIKHLSFYTWIVLHTHYIILSIWFKKKISV